MSWIKLILFSLPLAVACTPQEAPPSGTPQSQLTSESSDVILFEGGRLITGDGNVLEDAAFLIENGRFTQVGVSGTINVPVGAVQVNFSGKTIIPALIDGHGHLGYSDVGARTDVRASYSRENIIDHLHRHAYYGQSATMSMGIDPLSMAELRESTIDNAARFLWAGRGMGRPNAGPGATDRRDVPYGIDTVEEGIAAVHELAETQVDLVKIWVDDRNGSVEKLTPDLYRPIIKEAHRLGLKVTAHIFYLEDAKDLLRAGIDGFAHGIRDVDVDDEFMELLANRPYTFLMPNLPNSGSTTIDDLPFFAQTLPAAGAETMRTEISESTTHARFAVEARNLKRMYDAGVTLITGTDGDGAGWDIHEEIADMVLAGVSPTDALASATKNAAELYRLHDLGTISAGKSADFVILDSNPLEDIKNTREISNVYIRGEEVNRAELSANWTE
jgi:imidazolonepropionase-like amidohydrolase